MAIDWSLKLSRPLKPRDGAPIRTLADARSYVLAMDRWRQDKQAWEMATELMIEAAAGGSIAAATDQIETALFLEAKLETSP